MTDATPSLVCVHCSTPLVRKSRGPAPTYCSGKCRATAKYQRDKATGKDREYAARAKARADALRLAAARPCPYCGEPMTNSRRVQCGAPDCKRQHKAEYMKAWQRQFHAATGQWHPRLKHGDQQRESARLRWAERRSQGLPVGRQRYPDAYRANDAKRRARKQTVIIERFDHEEIYERDGWVCGLCQHPVDRTLTWPHPLSPTLDHIVPLAEHGDHSRANSRLAHAHCNTSRGARGGGEQLALIG